MATPNQTLAHDWFHARKPSDKGSNMYYEHNTIYSYGFHFPIAHYIDTPNNQRFCFFTSRDYSVTTSKHKTLTARAIDRDSCYLLHVHLEQGAIRSLHYALENHDYAYFREIAEFWSAELNDRAKHHLKRASRARLHKESALNSACSIAQEWGLLQNFLRIMFQVELVKPESILTADSITESELANYRAQAEQRKRLEQQNKELKAAQEIAAWKSGQSSNCPYFGAYFLRLHNNMLQTSGGIEIPIETVRKLLPLAISSLDGSATEHTFRLKGISEIAGFPIHSIDEKGRRIGCHYIPACEIKDIVDQLTLADLKED